MSELKGNLAAPQTLKGGIFVGGSKIELDTTLTQPGKAADAKAVGDALANVGGISTAEKTLLLSLFKNAAYTSDMSATIAQLETLWSGGDVPDLPEADVSQTGSILSIVSGVTASQSGSVLAIA